MPKYDDDIEAQYNEHPYPEPILDMDQKIDLGYQQGSCLTLIWQRLFPEKEYRDNLNILIAGCGTNQAIYHALKFPKSQHYAIDVSETSISHVRNMIEKYNIKNLIIEKKDILELKNKNEFDLVISTGVIHHTKDPQKSLNILVKATKDDGALFIMVYASYLRMGVYFLQDAFRYLDLKNTKKDIGVAKRLIELIPQNHYVNKYLDSAKVEDTTIVTSSQDMHYDAGFVDTFFNARDVSFNIDELKILINKSGSYFQGWYDNMFYYKKLFNFGAIESLNKEYMHLNNWELSDFTQKMSPSSGKFSFFLRKGKKYENRFFEIEELTASTYVQKIPFKLLEHDDDSFLQGVSKNIEKIIWLNIDNKIEDILKKSNEVISKEGFEEELSFNNIRTVLHHYWKEGKISFSDR
jgi:SAM-dependent methyltransferase